jgi:hypothetical protein
VYLARDDLDWLAVDVELAVLQDKRMRFSVVGSRGAEAEK